MPTRKEQSEATRKAIMEAGRKLLAQNDAKHISIAELMRQCNLSPGLFYHYYESKDAFIVAMITESWIQYDSYLYDEEPPVFERLRGYVRSAIKGTLESSSQLRRNLNSYRMSNEYIHEREKRLIDDYVFVHIRDFFNENIEKKIFSPELPVEFISYLYVYIIHGIDFNISLYDRDPRADRIWKWLDQFFDHLEADLLKPYML